MFSNVYEMIQIRIILHKHTNIWLAELRSEFPRQRRFNISEEAKCGNWGHSLNSNSKSSANANANAKYGTYMISKHGTYNEYCTMHSPIAATKESSIGSHKYILLIIVMLAKQLSMYRYKYIYIDYNCNHYYN